MLKRNCICILQCNGQETLPHILLLCGNMCLLLKPPRTQIQLFANNFRQWFGGLRFHMMAKFVNASWPPTCNYSIEVVGSVDDCEIWLNLIRTKKGGPRGNVRPPSIINAVGTCPKIHLVSCPNCEVSEEVKIKGKKYSCTCLWMLFKSSVEYNHSPPKESPKRIQCSQKNTWHIASIHQIPPHSSTFLLTSFQNQPKESIQTKIKPNFIPLPIMYPLQWLIYNPTSPLA